MGAADGRPLGDALGAGPGTHEADTVRRASAATLRARKEMAMTLRY